MTSIISIDAARARMHNADQCPSTRIAVGSLMQPEGHKSIPTPYVYERPSVELTDQEKAYFINEVGSRLRFQGNVMPSGAALFAEIESHDDYYIGEEESELLSIIPLHSDKKDVVITEFGPGSGRKTFPYVKRHHNLSPNLSYQAIDVSQDFLDMTMEGYKKLNIPTRSCCGDFLKAVHGFKPADLGLFVGTTIGNFEPEIAINLLRHMRTSFMKPGGLLLLGQDGNQDPTTLQYCYDDRSKITATFVLNALCHLKRDQAPDLCLSNFSYKAYFDPASHTMYMGIVSKVKQTVEIAGIDVEFAADEFIRVGQSYKYPSPLMRIMAAEAGFEPTDVYSSRRGVNIHVLHAGRF